jgi:hypothetical protein
MFLKACLGVLPNLTGDDAVSVGMSGNTRENGIVSEG